MTQQSAISALKVVDSERLQMRSIPVVLLLAMASPAFAQSPACDRACLEQTVDQFLDAFIKHDPARVPLTNDVKYTENGQHLLPGDGSWRTMVGKGTYRLFVDDVPAGSVAFIGTLREEDRAKKDGTPVLI